MALKIIPASEPIRVNRITMALYGQPGVGKSSLAFTASKPLLFDFDQGAHRAMNRKDVVRVASWQEVADVAVSDLEPFDTVIVDTAGRALDLLAADIIRRDPKMGKGGVLSQQGWGRMKAEFSGWLKLLHQAGKDVVLIAHGSEKINGDETIERLDVQGGSKDEIYKSADAMGRLAIRGGQRTLTFDPTETAFGKNPGQLEPLAVPSPAVSPLFLAEVIARTKEALNAQTDAMREAEATLERWRVRVADLADAEGFNSSIEDVQKESRAVQALFNRAATDRGLVFDKKAGAYVKPTAEAA